MTDPERPSTYRPIVEVPGRPVPVAHAGASGDAPENTMAAFELAISQGAGLVEVDVHLSADGHLVVHHDDSLERTTDAPTSLPDAAPWNIRDLTLDQIRQVSAGVHAGSPQRIPTLREVIDLVRERDVGLLVETKAEHATAALEPAVAEVVRTYPDWEQWVPARLMVGSFFIGSLRRMRDELPGVNLAFIAVSVVALHDEVVEASPLTPGLLEPGMTLQEVRDKLAHERIGYFGLAQFGVNGAPTNDFTADTIRFFRESGVEVNFVADDADTMRSYAERGVTSVLTSHPARLLEVLAHLED